MTPFDKAYNLAQSLDNSTPRWWSTNGPTLIAIAQHLAEGYFGPGVDWRAIPAPQRDLASQLIGAAMRWMDDQYGWDAPNMDEATEDLFYGFFAQLGVHQKITAV